MKHIVLCCMLLGGMAFAQGAPTTAPPYPTPTTPSRGQQTSQEPMPPDTQAPAPEAMSRERVEGLILHQLRAEPALSGTNVDAKVDDRSVTLTGNVDSTRQRDLAIHIAQSNAGNRKVIDKLVLKRRNGGS